MTERTASRRASERLRPLFAHDVGSVFVRYGASSDNPRLTLDPFRCDTRYPVEAGGQHLSAGDLDGDGRAELAIGVGSRVVLVRF